MTCKRSAWRKSSFSGNVQNCVELADAGSDVLLRNSRLPCAGHLAFTRTAMAAFVAGCKAGEFDSLE
jgi:hypothetical protein